MNVYVKKRKTRGPLYASLVGLGISAAVLGVKRGRRNKV
jgi:hypothetical protein